MPKSPILGGFAAARSPNASDNDSVNLGIEVVETKDGKVPGFLFGMSGLDLLTTVGPGPIRGVLPLRDLLYVVSGSEVWSLTTNFVKTFVGSIDSQNAPVSMFENGHQLMIVNGVAGWLVPGGYPLADGVITSGGALYTIGDTITLKAATGIQNSFPILTVTAVDSPSGTGAVTAVTIPQGGAIDNATLSFTQKSTSGSGSGFIFTAPVFGPFFGLVPVTLPFPNPVKGGISDGFGVLVFLNQQVLAASDELDLSTWDPLSFGIADQSPDSTISLAVIHDEVYVLKTGNTEVWSDVGTANFAFGPLTGVHMEFGCTAPFSTAIADQELIWLSRNSQGQGIFVKASAYQPVPISTQALTNELQTYSNLGDCIAYTRQEGGHVYYVATFPEANKTWVYDKTASDMVGYPLWCRMAAFSNGAFLRHWGNAFVPWRAGPIQIITNTSTYQAEGVTITTPTELDNAAPVGLPLDMTSVFFSDWLNLSGGAAGIVFGNQADITLGSTNPGLFISIQNDTAGAPEITVKAWDAAGAAIVSATYDFTTWGAWVWVGVSIDTATNQIAAWTGTLVASALVETELGAASLAWSSTNPIGNPAGKPWRVVPT